MVNNEIFSIIKDICLSAAAITTAIVAWRGVESWKKELKGRADFEVARGFIKATYKLRDALGVCRSPWTPASEFPEGYPRSAHERSSKEEGEAMAHIYGNRWDKVSICEQEFNVATLEAEALWGAEIETKARALRICVIELRVAIEAFIRNAYSGQKDREFAEKVRAVVRPEKPEENPLALKIQAAISGIEDKVRPHLSRN